MKQLVPFTPTNCDQPVAFISPDLPEWIQGVIDENWLKTCSGLGNHVYVEDMIQDETDPDILQEYWEEYSLWAWAEVRNLYSSLGYHNPNSSLT